MSDEIHIYNTRRYKRKKQLYRLKLGCSQLIAYPLLFVIFAIVVIATAFLMIKTDTLLAYLKISKDLYFFLNYCVVFLIITTALLVTIATLLGIGELTAQKDEGNLALAFDKKDLRNGFPILIYKKHIKKKSVIVREFYTTIPMEKWIDKKEAIADIFNEHFLIDFEYGGKTNNDGNKIILKSAKGRKNKDRGILYDENF
jgi:predicted membrane protein